MKRKVLAIVLSLALLSSFFVFTPVSAAPEEPPGQAPGFVELWFEFERTSDWYTIESVYHGPALPEPINRPGTTRRWIGWADFAINDSSFGPGTAIFTQTIITITR